MKLSEALIERADATKKLAELRVQINANLQTEKDEAPEEDIKELMETFTNLCMRLAQLIAAINKTNSTYVIPSGENKGQTIMELLAARDSLALLRNQYQTLGNQRVSVRYGTTKDDIRFELTFSPKEMRKEADALARKHRHIDTEIQALNWTVDLVDIPELK